MKYVARFVVLAVLLYLVLQEIAKLGEERED